ncbi:nuclear transport factor 2 family protein [Flexibacterium corallicola]|uniref:nuclear transport factor 2 family protein n=1 Tax=Flexibacterium corallicola TaxID=3037259 RepID=UPI00286EFE67|nr:nuclear transport factor 2 family protein [Pseudovibrio sp. M1P-2-3]
MADDRLEKWHKIVFERDNKLLSELLDDNVEFHSPTVWNPKEGKQITFFILTSVIQVFQDFEYHRELVVGNDMFLEFSAKVGDKNIKGIDMIKWDDNGKIVHFEVMVRPFNGLKDLYEIMNAKVRDLMAGKVSAA